jgi:ABC-type amino acid transport substrate-binding protein
MSTAPEFASVWCATTPRPWRSRAWSSTPGFDLPDDTFNALRDGNTEAFAAPRQILLEYSERLPSSRVLDEGYGINRVGIAVAKHRQGLLSYLTEYVEEAKASGLIERFIAEADLRGFQAAR